MLEDEELGLMCEKFCAAMKLRRVIDYHRSAGGPSASAAIMAAQCRIDELVSEVSAMRMNRIERLQKTAEEHQAAGLATPWLESQIRSINVLFRV